RRLPAAKRVRRRAERGPAAALDRLNIRPAANPSKAGSRGRVAATTIRTATATPTARPSKVDTSIKNRPMRETTTVEPAKITDRPAVARASPTASSDAPWRDRADR